MHVSCPSCGAVYDIPEHVLTAGTRRLRCARCATEWTPTLTGVPTQAPPAAPEVAEVTRRAQPAADADRRQAAAVADQTSLNVAEPTPADAATRRSAPPLVASPPLIQDRPNGEPAADRRRPGSVAALWAVSVAALIAGCFAAYFFRATVQSAWPPSQLLYAALGLS